MFIILLVLYFVYFRLIIEDFCKYSLEWNVRAVKVFSVWYGVNVIELGRRNEKGNPVKFLMMQPVQSPILKLAFHNVV